MFCFQSDKNSVLSIGHFLIEIDYNVELRNCKPFLLIEGHLVLAHDWTEVCDRQLRFFFTIDQKSCLERRHARTYIPPDPPTFFTGNHYFTKKFLRT